MPEAATRAARNLSVAELWATALTPVEDRTFDVERRDLELGEAVAVGTDDLLNPSTFRQVGFVRSFRARAVADDEAAEFPEDSNERSREVANESATVDFEEFVKEEEEDENEDRASDVAVRNLWVELSVNTDEGVNVGRGRGRGRVDKPRTEARTDVCILKKILCGCRVVFCCKNLECVGWRDGKCVELDFMNAIVVMMKIRLLKNRRLIL